MKTKLLLTLTSCAVLAGSALAADPAANPNADNTATNARDKSGQTLTPVDQSNTPADLKITAETRKAVVADKALSMDAKNVKIITVDAVVTLRGPVDSKEERATIEKYAVQSGATTVTNDLEVKSTK